MAQRRLLLIAILLLVPALAFAQDATVIGTVTDSTGGVLPGVTVTAVHATTGNTFETITDERGNFRIPGTHRRLSHQRAAAGVHPRRQDDGAAGRLRGPRQSPARARFAPGKRDGHVGSAAR